MNHELKTWSEHFQAIKLREKPFELRFNGRNFQVGDTLKLREWDPKTRQYTGNIITRQITCVITIAPALTPGYAALGLK